MPHLFPDLQRPLAQGFSFLVFAPLAIQHGQVVEGCRHGGVILPKSLLTDCQCVVQEVGCLFVLILIPVQSKACYSLVFMIMKRVLTQHAALHTLS